jgi:hypothetical protein
MTPLFEINEGDRPSRLELARQLTGELERVDSPALDALQADVERPGLAPFDWEILSSAAHRETEDEARPAAAPPTRSFWRWVGFLTPAALVLGALVLALPQPATLEIVPMVDRPGLKGPEVDLDFLVAEGERFRPGIPGETLAAGDRIQLSYKTAGLNNLVLVGVDGTGEISVYYPAQGDVPEPIIPGERHMLDGSLILDGAPGPEVFVAAFGAGSVAEVEEFVTDTFVSSGHDGLQALDSLFGVDTLRVEKE